MIQAHGAQTWPRGTGPGRCRRRCPVARTGRKDRVMGTLVSYQPGHSVATITMDDGKVNALSPQMLSELGAALDRAAEDREVVVLTGRPGTFSAGFDLRVLRGGGATAS